MARFGFSVLAVVFFLALFASAAPTPRDGKQAQPANKGSGAIPAEAMQAMKEASKALSQMEGAHANKNTQANKDAQAMPSSSNQEDKQANAAKGAYAAENALPPVTGTSTDNSHNNKPAQAAAALQAASSAASNAQHQQASPSPASKNSHTVHNDPLAGIPIIGGVLSGGGLPKLGGLPI